MHRTFTRAELEDLELPDGDTVVHTEQIGEKRWATIHHCVFRAEDSGPLWRVTYYKAGNELSDVDTWGYGYELDTIDAIQVEPYEETVTRYRPVAIQEGQ